MHTQLSLSTTVGILAVLLSCTAASFVRHNVGYSAPRKFFGNPRAAPVSMPASGRQYGVYSVTFHGDDYAEAYLGGEYQATSSVQDDGSYSEGFLYGRAGQKAYFAVKNEYLSGGLEAKITYGSQLVAVTRGQGDQPANGPRTVTPRYTFDKSKAADCVYERDACDDASWTPAKQVYPLCNAGKCGTGYMSGTGSFFVGPDGGNPVNFHGYVYMVLDI